MVASALAAPLAAVSVSLLITAETWRGRHYALTALLLLALPWLVLRASKRTAIGAVAAFLASYALMVALSANGKPLPGSPLRSDFNGRASYDRTSVFTLLPEIDQIKLGTFLVPFVDPLIDRREAAALRASSMRWYRPMEADPEFRALGTVMSFAYADEDPDHVYAYAPPHAPEERLPAIVFLHGSGGNFKAYFYMWKRFADDAHVVVVCPSFGFGNWYEPGGTEAVERARTYAVTKLGADERRVFLAGLSNGGTGVTRAASDRPERWAGLVFLSAVIERSIITAPSFTHVPGRRVLVIHGMTDDRIPISIIDDAIIDLRSGGARVDSWLVPAEDHFLFFDRGEDVLARVREWLAL